MEDADLCIRLHEAGPSLHTSGVNFLLWEASVGTYLLAFLVADLPEVGKFAKRVSASIALYALRARQNLWIGCCEACICLWLQGCEGCDSVGEHHPFIQKIKRYSRRRRGRIVMVSSPPFVRTVLHHTICPLFFSRADTVVLCAVK